VESVDVVRMVCNKIIKEKKIENFNRFHLRAMLCFIKHRKLQLYEAVMLMDENKIKTKHTLDKLVELEVIGYLAPDYLMNNPFDALNTLIDHCKT
jgi:hypothetical protein